MESTVDATRPYQVCLHLGPATDLGPNVKAVDLTPAAPTADSVLEALRGSSLAPADMRSRVLVQLGQDGPTSALLYAALIGFAGRRLDVSFQGQSHLLADLDANLRALPDAGRPEEAINQVQIGGPARTDMPYLPAIDPNNRVAVSIVRYAKRVRLVVSGDPLTAVLQLVAVSALRRGKVDRLPFLVVGEEPAPTEDAPLAEAGICLDTLRRNAEDLRRSLRSDNRDSLAPAQEPTARSKRLDAAGNIDIETVLTRLGSKIGEAGEDWHCPRPERHTNGDQNASMKVTRGRVRCYRCDPERIDALRLVMDVLRVSPDEAADWLLSDQVRLAA